jgi:tetratricopeptide (TPR) repeat protein
VTPSTWFSLPTKPGLSVAFLFIVALAAMSFRGPASRADVPAGRSAEEAYQEALRLYRAGRFSEALEVIDDAARRDGWSAALHTLAGWCHLRGGSLQAADSQFRAALILEPSAVEPQVGLGYTLLRQGSAGAADERFERALHRDPRNTDALKGSGLALRDLKRFGEAADRFRLALRTSPGDPEATAFLNQVLAASGEAREVRPRPAAPADAPIRVVARAGDRRFFVSDGDRSRPIFIKGINMGVALPGRFPAEFPEDEATYSRWLDLVSGMGANTIRLYTLLPPVFYAALDKHNRRAGEKLWLVQGVWTELPEDDDYDAPSFLGGFKDEIRRVVDAVHGNLDLPARPGHASGSYRADLSGSLLAYLLGREWEPYSVEAYEARTRGGKASFRGAYFEARWEDGATRFERWLAAVIDFTADYETGRYRQQRPISFVNWPTLDPLTHPTEPTVAEERALLARMGEGAMAERIREYDNDGIGVDAAHIRPTAAARGGTFATYHAYPYYPDFMNLDPGYRRARDSRGPSNYIGYLRDLAAHHADQPILIAEIGVPSSRGIAHLQPQGMNHGGHSEREQGEIDARLMGDIREAGLAGGILFSLIDEWFKRNWLVTEFEIPAERNPLWLNVLDPEQNYGVLAARPGETGWKVTIDGRGDDWAAIPPLVEKRAGGPERPVGDRHDAARTLRALAVTSDEAYLYLRLEVGKIDADGDGAPDWKEASYLIGIDTYDARRGDHRMPLRGVVPSPAGLEFCLVFDGDDTSRLLIDPPYDIQTHRAHRPYQSVENADGRFMEIRVETNRMRVGRNGTVYPAQDTSRSPLRRGSIDPRDPEHSSLADWQVSLSGNFIEARIGWGLLNVTDPSSRRVLQDNPNDLRSIGTVVTDGFRFYVVSYRPEGISAGGETPIRGALADRLPAGDGLKAADLPLYAWRGWDRPTYRVEKKESWSILRRAFEGMPSEEQAP